MKAAIAVLFFAWVICALGFAIACMIQFDFFPADILPATLK